MSKAIKKLDSRIEEITPQRALELLGDNNGNRNLSQKTVDRYANSMANDNWSLTGDPIRVADTGRLIDGQHRLTAVVQSGKPITSVVIYGMPEAIFDKIDVGKVRNGADALSIAGCAKYATYKAAALRGYNAFVKGRGTRDMGGYNMRLENSELVEFYKDNKDVDYIIDLGADDYPAALKLMGYGAFAVTFYTLYKIDKELTYKLFSGLNTGANLPPTSPILALRNKFMSIRASGYRIRTREMIRLTCAAWVALRGRKRVTEIEAEECYYYNDLKG